MAMPVGAITTGPLVITAGQVAHLIGMSEDGFRKKRQPLERSGFPPRLPGLNKWSLAAVTRWVETNGQNSEPAPEQRTGSIANEASALEARYAGAGR